MLKAPQEAVWFGEFSSFTLWPNHMVSISTSAHGWRWDCPGYAGVQPAEVANNGAAVSQHKKSFNCKIHDKMKGPPQFGIVGKESQRTGKKKEEERGRNPMASNYLFPFIPPLAWGHEHTPWLPTHLTVDDVEKLCPSCSSGTYLLWSPILLPRAEGGLRTESTQLSSWMPWEGTPSSITISHSILF